MRSGRLSFVLLTTLILAGCASEPVEEINAVDSALAEARNLEAPAYAPEAWETANDAKARLDAELAAQQERFALLRSYKAAQQLAAEAKNSAEMAQQNAVQAKQQARDEASVLVAEARAEFTRAQETLQNAPRGKGTQADLAALNADVSGIEPVLAEMEAAFEAEDYLTAKTKAESAIEAARSIITEVENAKAATGRV